MSRTASVRAVVLLLAADAAVVLLNSEAVVALGPDFTRALGIPGSELGLVSAAFQAGGALACLAGAFLFDHVGRRRLMVFALAGFAACAFATGLARGLPSLLAIRGACALFASTANITLLAVLADCVPPEGRGRAMAAVTSSYALVLVAGIPGLLELSRALGWRIAFHAVGVAGAVAAAASFAILPPLRDHLGARAAPPPLQLRPAARWTLLLAALAPAPGVLLIANVPIYVLGNLGFPRAGLSGMFLATGVAGFAATRAMGRLVDRYGPLRSFAWSFVPFAAAIGVGFFLPLGSAVALSVALEVTVVPRVVPFQALLTHVPRPAERGRFMAVQAIASNAGGAAAAWAGVRMLSTAPGEKLVGMPRLAATALAAAVAAIAVMWWIERLRRREAADQPPSSTASLSSQT